MTKVIISTYDSVDNPYYGGGGAIAIHETAKRLVKNFKVMVISGAYPKSKNHVKDGVFYQFIGPKNLPPKISQFVYSFLLPWKVITSKFDVWFESFTPPFSTACLQIFTKKPVIGIAHMLSGEDMKNKFHLPFDLIENLGLKTYKKIIATSDTFAKKMKKMAPNASVFIIPNGIDKVEPIKQKGNIIYCGRIEVKQRIRYFNKNIAKLKKELIICGSGEKGRYQN
jgi:ATP-dependent exoDNAse (exonuclease V) alpha subunit